MAVAIDQHAGSMACTLIGNQRLATAQCSALWPTADRL
ncbi:hypothetical protein ADIMK_1637 [Marinobacterium lacunae]|uniref:Uncharacterized protein n=1 Tax=Marinobacterium lacunae TaxID=1232683 RepID=A0A081G0T6_9GAMM|nr:hypothetical protein ADIMK_1637 [Marinobacterium lacunae]